MNSVKQNIDHKLYKWLSCDRCGEVPRVPGAMDTTWEASPSPTLVEAVTQKL